MTDPFLIFPIGTILLGAAFLARWCYHWLDDKIDDWLDVLHDEPNP